MHGKRGCERGRILFPEAYIDNASHIDGMESFDLPFDSGVSAFLFSVTGNEAACAFAGIDSQCI